MITQQLEKPTRTKKYAWQVVQDPTRKDDDPGLFYGHLFRYSDVFALSNESTTYWPEGIVFRNIRTGKTIKYQHGSPVTVIK